MSLQQMSRAALKMKYPDLKGTIFIVTYGRSGSTILQSLLQSIPDTHITGENNNVLASLFQAAQSASNTRQAWGKKEQPKTHPWYGADKIKTRRIEQRLTRVFIEEIIQPHKDVRWVGFKEIRYPQLGKDLPKFLNFCNRNFPNPYFVFNSRNGKNVAKSKWWANKPENKVLNLVADMDAAFANYSSRHPENTFHAKYEDVIENPKCLQPLFQKLGEDFDLDLANKILSKKLTH